MADILVVDCSVAAKWVLAEPDAWQATELLESDRSGKVSLVAPDLLLTEFASLIAKRARRKQLPVDQAHQMFWIIEHSDLEFVETRRLLVAALELALTNQMSSRSAVSGHAPSRNVRMDPKTSSGASIQGACAASGTVSSRAWGRRVAQSRPPP
jgi:predicted nucleic acid-binding protein